MAFSIFKDGEIGGAEYKNVRDDLEIQDFRDWINSTTEQYLPYCGDNLTHLRNIASDNFQGFLWQLFVFEFLQSGGLELKKSSPAGPDFCLNLDGKTVWVEAISVTRGQGDLQVPEPEYEDVEIDGTIIKSASWCRTHPDPLIKLRLTEAIQRKHGDFSGNNGYLDYLTKGIVKTSEPYLIALNYGEIPFVFNVTDPSYISMTVFGLGPYSISFDRKSLKSQGGKYLDQPNVNKKNAEVETAYFNRSTYTGISGIIASPERVSSLKYSNQPQVEIVPNPEARNPVPNEILGLEFTSVVSFEDIPGGKRIHFKK